jgi:small neutral amino acid transporter SnatA (MarC family)
MAVCLILPLASLELIKDSTPEIETGYSGEDCRALAVVPLAISLTVGGGVMTLIVSFTSSHGSFLDLTHISASCILIPLTCILVYSSAQAVPCCPEIYRACHPR